MTTEDKLNLLRKEVYQSIVEHEEACKLLKQYYPGVASLYDHAACRAKEVYEATS